MSGRIRRRLLESRLDSLQAPPAEDPACPLCGRPIPPSERDAHHLVPRSHGGRDTVLLHRICHRQVHALLTESELARTYATVDALREHPALQAFVRWVRTKPAGFRERVRKSERVRRR